MKCPDCGSRLSEIMAEGILCHRCYKCGGFFAPSQVINRLTTATVNTWRRIKIDPMWLSGGKGLCPQDGTMLQKYMGDAVPGTIDVKRCIRCGKWWFPGDALHEFKPAQEAKSLYFRLWGVVQDAASLVLPIVAGIAVLGGLGMSLLLVGRPQRLSVPAYQQAPGVRLEAGNRGELVVYVTGGQAGAEVAYRALGTEQWRTSTLRAYSATTQVAYIQGLTVGLVYDVVVAGQELQIQAK